MKKLIVILLAALGSSAVLAAAHTAVPAATATNRAPDPKQTARCNSEANVKDLKRAERKTFLKSCMAGTANSTAAPQSLSGIDKPALETAKP